MSANEFVEAAKACDSAREQLVRHADALKQLAEDLLAPNSVNFTGITANAPKTVRLNGKIFHAEKFPNVLALADAVANYFTAKELRDQAYDALPEDQQRYLLKSGD